MFRHLIATTALVFGLGLGLGLPGLPGCSDTEPPHAVVEDMIITGIAPTIVLAGSTLVIEGFSFADEVVGTSQLRLRGIYAEQEVDTAFPVRFVNYSRLEITVDDRITSLLPTPTGTFSGEVVVEVVNDGRVIYSSAPRLVNLEVNTTLVPEITSLDLGNAAFVNEVVSIRGNGLLLADTEGTTTAIIEGCILPEGLPSCPVVKAVAIPVTPATDIDRDHGTVVLTPEITGIEPGTFSGTIKLRNTHTVGEVRESGILPLDVTVVPAEIKSFATTAASLGQYVDITGYGFVGGGSGETLLRLQGEFSRDNQGDSIVVDTLLVSEFVSGSHIRYILDESDNLGRAVDLRRETGTFVGTVAPVVRFGSDESTGHGTEISLYIAPVKQVVYLNFRPSYNESLRHFGLRAVDEQIRKRILDVVRRDYDTINVEFRESPPGDFALYTEVQIAGPDPNGLGLLGYDNTPGKDRDNLRLYDRIGGVNAITQEDGFPGYGGVFIESLLVFSEHPGEFAEAGPTGDPRFDQIFDPFRPDRDGTPVRASDFQTGIDELSNAAQCPAIGPRSLQIGCAVWVLGTLIGHTVSHELGHSLGLANPYSSGFHNGGDVPNRLMESGGSRPFVERAELLGAGPARFCEQEYEYLRTILPSAKPADTSPRPRCF